MTPYIAFFVSAIFFAVCNLAVRAGDIVRELKRFNDREEEWERELKRTARFDGGRNERSRDELRRD